MVRRSCGKTALRDLRDLREHLTNVEHARKHPQQLFRRLQVRFPRVVERRLDRSSSWRADGVPLTALTVEVRCPW